MLVGVEPPWLRSLDGDLLAIPLGPREDEADLPLVLLVCSPTEEPLAAFLGPALGPECAAEPAVVPGEAKADVRDEVEDAASSGDGGGTAATPAARARKGRNPVPAGKLSPLPVHCTIEL